MTLFELPEPKHSINDKTCKKCVYSEPWQCGQRVIYYCEIRKSNRTTNGQLKIRLKDPACLSFSQFKKCDCGSDMILNENKYWQCPNCCNTRAK